MTQTNRVSTWTKAMIAWDFMLAGWDLRYGVELYSKGQTEFAALLVVLAVLLFFCGIALLQVADW